MQFVTQLGIRVAGSLGDPRAVARVFSMQMFSSNGTLLVEFVNIWGLRKMVNGILTSLVVYYLIFVLSGLCWNRNQIFDFCRVSIDLFLIMFINDIWGYVL